MGQRQSHSKQDDHRSLQESSDEDDGTSSASEISINSRLTDYFPQPNALQVEFMELVVAGDVQTLSEFVRTHELSPNLYSNCMNHRGQTALEVAVSRQDIGMVLSLVRLGVSRKSIECSLIRATEIGSIGLVKLLLDAGSIDAKTSGHKQRTCCLDYSCDLDPLLMAAQRDHYDIIRLLLARGFRIRNPHSAKCKCDQCIKQANKAHSLQWTTVRLNAYRAITSASYLSLTSSDPILTAFHLYGELKDWSVREPEFKDDYMRFADSCAKYAVALVGHCRTSEEMMEILNKRTLEEKRSKKGPKEELFSRIALAIRYDLKEFVTHSNCQEVMRNEWLKYWDGNTSVEWSTLIRTFVLRLFLMPFIAVVYWVAPSSGLAQSWTSPLTKYITAMAAYVGFLVALLVQNHLDAAYGNRGPPNTRLEIFIILFVVGIGWKNLSMFWMYGYEMYTRHGWNLYDIAMLTSFIFTFACWCLSLLDVKRNGNADLLRPKWSQYDPRLIGEMFYAVACILAIVKLTFFMQLTSYFGPLQVSLSRLLGDLASYLCMMLLFVVAFATGLWVIYRGYSGNVRHTLANDTLTQAQSYNILPRAMTTIYWSLYGLEGIANNDVIVPEYTVNVGNDTVKTVYNDHRATELVGYSLYGVTAFCCIVIMINMLIAVMTNSLTAVQEQADVEWKYARTMVWLNFFIDGDVVPSPFNLVPSVQSFVHLFRWCFHRVRGVGSTERHRDRDERNQPRARCNCFHCCHFDGYDRHSARKEEESYYKVISTLIQRHFSALSLGSNADEKRTGKSFDGNYEETSRVKKAEGHSDSSDLDFVKMQLRELTKMVQLLQLSVLSPMKRESTATHSTIVK